MTYAVIPYQIYQPARAGNLPIPAKLPVYRWSTTLQNWNIPWDITYLWNVFLHLSLSVYAKGFLDHFCLCNIWIQQEWIWIGHEQIWERKRKKYLLTMTRIFKQPRNISESFIFVRENILKSDLIYLLRWEQKCYVYVYLEEPARVTQHNQD